MSKSRKVTVVIVTYQSRNTIDQTLDVLHPAYEAGFASCVVVDNASSDGTADHVADKYPWVELVRSPENLGFGRGCNLGGESAVTPYLLFLNPDANIGLAGLETLVDFLESHPRAGIVGPATEIKGWDLFQPAGMLLTPERLILSSLGLGDIHPKQRVIEPGSAPFQTNWICGAVLMVRSDLFTELGGFDPRYFLYFEETDLCLRAARKGMELWAVGEAYAEHLAGVSAKSSGKEMTGEPVGACIAMYFYPSRFYYLGKNYGWIRAVTAEVMSGTLEWLRWQRSALCNRGQRRDSNRPGRWLLKLPSKSA